MDEFASHSGIRWNGHVGTVEYGGGDRTMVCMFYNKPVVNAVKSKTNGRPYFEDVVFVRIHPPGERLNIVDRKATDADRRRFPMQWEQFKQQKEQIPEGTPIDLLYPENPAIGSTLRANGVHTVEQCSDLSANAIENIGMGCQHWVNAAKKYLEAAAKGVSASQLRHELEERDRELNVAKRHIEQLQGRIAQLEQMTQAAPSLEQVQAMIAGVMARPQFVPGVKVDPQQAMINATNSVARGSQEPVRRPRLKK